MSTHSSYDKSDWGDGPWQTEPDGGAWTTESGLLGCFIRHPRYGNLNGYVAVTPDHPLYGKGYEDPDVSVHGGLTFAGSLTEPERKPYFADVLIDVDERLWWFGFDCSHWNDYEPALAALDRKTGFTPVNKPGKYKTVAYVRAEVESLALQLVVPVPA